MITTRNPVGVKEIELNSEILAELVNPAYTEVVCLRGHLKQYIEYRDETLAEVQKFKRSRNWINKLLDPDLKRQLETAMKNAEREDADMRKYQDTLMSSSWENTVQLVTIPGKIKLEEVALLNIFNYKPDNTRYHIDRISQAQNAYKEIQKLLTSTLSVGRAVKLVEFISGKG